MITVIIYFTASLLALLLKLLLNQLFLIQRHTLTQLFLMQRHMPNRSLSTTIHEYTLLHLLRLLLHLLLLLFLKAIMIVI